MSTALLVATGAGLGAVARYLLSLGVGDGLLGILLINVVGCLALGYFRPGPFWGSGFLGGFTTFSAYALLTANQEWYGALAYTVLTVAACVGAVLFGRFLIDAPSRRP